MAMARVAPDGFDIVFENVGGAGGTVGATRASEAAPDGYTLFAASMGTIIAAPTFYPNLKYDSTKDFEPIGMSANAPAAVSINKNIPVKDLKEFIAWAKQKGPDVKQAFGGVGGTSHMACLLFNQVAGIKPEWYFFFVYYPLELLPFWTIVVGMTLFMSSIGLLFSLISEDVRTALGRSFFVLILLVLSASCFWLIPAFGLEGAAWALALASGLQLVGSGVVVSRSTRGAVR